MSTLLTTLKTRSNQERAETDRQTDTDRQTQTAVKIAPCTCSVFDDDCDDG